MLQFIIRQFLRGGTNSEKDVRAIVGNRLRRTVGGLYQLEDVGLFHDGRILLQWVVYNHNILNKMKGHAW